MTGAADTDVAVVGAGLAGLVAARRLAQAGVEVVVLEARERVGGRLESAPIGAGEQVEIGGQWVGPTQSRVLALARELGLELFPTRTQGRNVIEVEGRLRRYRGTIPRLGPLVLLDLERTRRRLARIARAVDPEAPWLAPDARGLDAASLGDWLERTTRTRLARELIALSCRTVWGAEPREMSLLYVLSYIRAGGSFDALLDVEGGAQQDRVVGGSQLLATRIADQLGARVRTGAPVERIAWDAGGVVLGTGAAMVRARRAVISVPPAALARIAFEPDLPEAHRELARSMPGGRLIKVAAVYDEPFWRADGLSGEAVSLTGPVTVTFDNSPPPGSPGVLTGFVGGADIERYAGLPADERRRVALASLARVFGPRAERAAEFLERDWAAEQWSLGGPVSIMGPGTLSRLGPALRDPVGPLHWAGAERATRWCGYMDGAVRSGEAAAAAITRSLAAGTA